MVLTRVSADPTPLSSGWTMSGFPADPPSSPTPTSPKPTNTTTTTTTTPTPSVTYIDIQALIRNNCSFLHPGPLTLATSHRDNTWTAHVTSGPRILLSASAPDLNGAFDALHRKSAEAVASRLVTAPPSPPDYAEMESYSEDQGEEEEEEDEDDDEEQEEYAPSWGSVSEPYPCCGCGHGPRTRTRLLPIRRPAPRQRMIPPPPPRTVPPPPPPEDTVPPPPRPPTSPCPPPAILRSPTDGPRFPAPPKDNIRGEGIGLTARLAVTGRDGLGLDGMAELDC